MEVNRVKQEARKHIIHQHCITLGAFITANKLSGNIHDFDILIEFLEKNGFKDVARCIIKEYLSEAHYSRYSSLTNGHNFSEVETLKNYKSTMRTNFTQALIPEKNWVAGDSEAGKKLVENMPLHDEFGVEYLTTKYLGIHDIIKCVETLEDFRDAAEFILYNEETIGIDFIFASSVFLSTITIAADDIVIVFDIVKLGLIDEIKEFFCSLLTDPNIVKITYGLNHDIIPLAKVIKLRYSTLNRVYELTDLIHNSYKEKQGMQKILSRYLGRRVNKAWNNFSWKSRELHPGMIDHCAILATVNLKLYDELIAREEVIEEENIEFKFSRKEYFESELQACRDRIAPWDIEENEFNHQLSMKNDTYSDNKDGFDSNRSQNNEHYDEEEEYLPAINEITSTNKPVAIREQSATRLEKELGFSIPNQTPQGIQQVTPNPSNHYAAKKDDDNEEEPVKKKTRRGGKKRTEKKRRKLKRMGLLETPVFVKME